MQPIIDSFFWQSYRRVQIRKNHRSYLSVQTLFSRASTVGHWYPWNFSIVISRAIYQFN
jgi:hypothetical protein